MSRDNRGDTVFGAAAVVAVIACCGLPVLLSAGVLAGAGALLRNAFLVGIGLAALAGLIVWAHRRTRSGAACEAEAQVRPERRLTGDRRRS